MGGAGANYAELDSKRYFTMKTCKPREKTSKSERYSHVIRRSMKGGPKKKRGNERGRVGVNCKSKGKANGKNAECPVGICFAKNGQSPDATKAKAVNLGKAEGTGGR